MRIHHRHSWDLSTGNLSTGEARALQERLRAHVVTEDRFRPPRTVAGVDLGFHAARGLCRAAVVVLDFPSLAPRAQAVAVQPIAFPYVPGLLSFREIPTALAAFARLAALPDMILCDGQGFAHPRRFGLACHLGVLLDRPAIGAAKTRLVGGHGEVPAGRGEWTGLYDGDECIGAVLRTRAGVKPIFVSVGHRINLASAVAFVMRCTTRYRLPETTRHAHHLASATPW